MLRLKVVIMASTLASSLIGPPKACEAAPGSVTRDSNPLLDNVPPLPSALPQYAPRAGKGFFFIEKLHSGQWRCVVKSATGRVTAWRDFGYTAEDYLRAWEWGNEWVGS